MLLSGGMRITLEIRSSSDLLDESCIVSVVVRARIISEVRLAEPCRPGLPSGG